MQASSVACSGSASPCWDLGLRLCAPHPTSTPSKHLVFRFMLGWGSGLREHVEAEVAGQALTMKVKEKRKGRVLKMTTVATVTSPVPERSQCARYTYHAPQPPSQLILATIT